MPRDRLGRTDTERMDSWLVDELFGSRWQVRFRGNGLRPFGVPPACFEPQCTLGSWHLAGH